MVSLPFILESVVGTPLSQFSIENSTIENRRVTETDSGYALKAVKAQEIPLKLIIRYESVIDTVEAECTVDSNGTIIATTGTDSSRVFTLTSSAVYAGMKLIPAGTFLMCPDTSVFFSSPQRTRQVTLTHDFWIDSTEVTQKDYAELMTRFYEQYVLPDYSIGYGTGDDYPAHTVSWIYAILYCNARTKAAGSTDTVYRYTAIEWHPDSASRSKTVLNDLVIDPSRGGFHLPTEAQWEYAY